MINDTLLINLKIISKIPKNGRICRSYDGVISLEQDSILQSIKRFLTKDSRKQAIFEINSIITECIYNVNNILNSKYISSNNKNDESFLKYCEYLEILVTEMENAKGGLQNLKFTYATDYNTSSQLDIALLKMSNTIKDVRNKLKCLLPNQTISINIPETLSSNTQQQPHNSITQYSSPKTSLANSESPSHTLPSSFFDGP